MKFLEIDNEQFSTLAQKFYDDSSLTFIGMLPEEAQLYVDFFKDFTEVNQEETGYILKGNVMNKYYHLRGSVKYPENLNILVVPLSAFKDVGAIAIPRFRIGGRWFDDIVDNNNRH